MEIGLYPERITLDRSHRRLRTFFDGKLLKLLEFGLHVCEACSSYYSKFSGNLLPLRLLFVGLPIAKFFRPFSGRVSFSTTTGLLYLAVIDPAMRCNGALSSVPLSDLL